MMARRRPRRIPRGAFGDGATRTLLAVIAGARTVRGVAHATGTAPATALWHLRHLRAAGLVDWKDDGTATIHATVRRVQ